MFIKEGKNLTRFKDGVFALSNMAKADSDPNTINATVGSLCGEDGQLVALDSVFNEYDKVTNRQKAAYAKGALGNPDFLKAMEKFVLEDKVKGSAIATNGGTAAIALALDMCRKEEETVILPSVAWGNYKLMVEERNLKVALYNPYDLNDLKDKMSKESKPFVVINSPCENPCGLSYTYDQWKDILDYCSSFKETIILNDIAYIDYAYDENAKKYMELFNELKENVLVLVASSCSKAFSYYGQRLGCLLVINSNEEFKDLFVNQCEKHIRTSYSSVNNGAMIAITNLLNNNYDAYLKEKNKYRDLLKERSDLFVSEAKECGLDIYPYNEGFFITVKYEDNDFRDKVHDALIKNHIYCVKLNKGIRVGICATSLKEVKGLAKKIKDTENSVR